jgi:hypothetical protein
MVALVACSPQDQRQANRDLKKSGEAVKKELKNDAAFVKQEALKAREETQKGVRKLKENVNKDDKSDQR